MFDNLDEAFEELDKKEYSFFAKALGAYKKALEDEGFHPDEAMELVVGYAKFVYDMGLEEFIADREKRLRDEDVDDDDDELI